MQDNPSHQITPTENAETIFTPEEFSVDGYDKHIRQARNAIFTAAALVLVNLIILGFTVPDDYEYYWIDCLIWGAFIIGFVILALWTKKKPYSALIGALILYILFIGLNALVDVTSIVKGIIFKIIIIAYLIKGLKDAREAQQLKQLNS